MIYSKEDVKRMLEKIRQVPRYDLYINPGHCEYCSESIDWTPAKIQREGVAVRSYDLDQLLREIEGSL